MKIRLAAILLLLFSLPAWSAFEYTYQSPAYGSSPGFDEVAFAPWTAEMSVFIQFTVAQPLPPNRTVFLVGNLPPNPGYDIIPATSWSIFDGVNRFSQGNAEPLGGPDGPGLYLVTDAQGEIQFLFASLWSPKTPHSLDTSLDFFIGQVFPGASSNFQSINDLECVTVTDGLCDDLAEGPEFRFINVQFEEAGAFTVRVPPIPSLSVAGLGTLALLLLMMGLYFRRSATN